MAESSSDDGRFATFPNAEAFAAVFNLVELDELFSIKENDNDCIIVSVSRRHVFAKLEVVEHQYGAKVAGAVCSADFMALIHPKMCEFVRRVCHSFSIENVPYVVVKRIESSSFYLLFDLLPAHKTQTSGSRGHCRS
jgi:hypothetical protein